MKRRQVLALSGTSLVPAAGCLGSDGVLPGSDRSLAVGETYETSDGATVGVSDARVRRLVRSTSVGSSTHVDVACLDGHQFAVAEATATDAERTAILSDLRFALEVDGVRYPREDQHWYWALPPGSNDRPGVPAFPAPVADATDAAVVWLRDDGPPVRWRLATETVDRLGTAPSFAVSSFETPDSVSRGHLVEARFTVANTGTREGRFVAEFGAGPLSDHPEVTVDVPTGSERTPTAMLDPHYPEDAEEIGVTLDWGCDRLHRTVAVTD